jgi:hypothetical protein
VDDAPEMTEEEAYRHSVLRRKAMVGHCLKTLAGQGVKAILVMSVEEVEEMLGCNPEQAAQTLDLAAADHRIDIKAVMTPIFERVKAGETMKTFMESQVANADPDVA